MKQFRSKGFNREDRRQARQEKEARLWRSKIDQESDECQRIRLLDLYRVRR